MSDLKNIKIEENIDKEDAKLMLRYTKYFADHAITSELRTHWTFIYKWINKHLRRK